VDNSPENERASSNHASERSSPSRCLKNRRWTTGVSVSRFLRLLRFFAAIEPAPIFFLALPADALKIRGILTNELLIARNIVKVFPGVRALDGVELTLRQGEIHALMGENGAGKSTLIKILTGVYQRDQGSIQFEGSNISPKSTKEAEAAGISTVYQEVNLIPTLSVAENILLGRQPRRLGLIHWKKVKERAVEHFENTVILTTHIAREVEQLCDRIATLHHGAITYLGSVEALGRSLDLTVTYAMTVTGLTPVISERLRARKGVVRCTAVEAEGVTEIELVFEREAITLSDVLRLLLFNNVDVLRCSLQERSLEETFRAVFDTRATPTVSAGTTNAQR